VGKRVSRGAQAHTAEEVVRATERMVESAGKLGIATKEGIQGFFDTFRKIIGNEIGQIEIWVGKLTGAKGLKGKDFENISWKSLEAKGHLK